jgi:Glyoxalase-like domain
VGFARRVVNELATLLRGGQDDLMATIRDLVFDAAHPSSIARFWAQVLDGYDVAAYDEAELSRLREAGIYDTEDDPAVLVEACAGVRPRLFFQLVPEGKATKNRVHLDLTCADLQAEVGRLTGLGAQVLARHGPWVTMADPEGNEFCVFPD